MKNITSYPSFLVVTCHTSARLPLSPLFFPPFLSFSYLTCSDVYILCSLSRDLFLCHLYIFSFSLLYARTCLALHETCVNSLIHFSTLPCDAIRHLARRIISRFAIMRYYNYPVHRRRKHGVYSIARFTSNYTTREPSDI